VADPVSFAPASGSTRRGFPWALAFGLVGLALLLAGAYVGLFVAPSERYMGDVQRIMYVHVPSAWTSLLAFTAAFGFAIAALWSGRDKWDAALVGAVEVGVILNALVLAQGMIWGKATWGVWWDWDVRLTTTLIMLLLFTGVLALRGFIDDARRRVTWSAIAVIVSYVDVPLVYLCVRWWRSLHQVQSTPETVHPLMVLPLRLSAFGMIFLAVWMITRRAQIELERGRREAVAPPERLARLQPTSPGRSAS
jgi:heme exporter protein C